MVYQTSAPKRSRWPLMTYHGVAGSAFFFAGQGVTWSRGLIRWGTSSKLPRDVSTKSSCRTAQRGHTKHLLPTSTNRRLSQNRLASRMSSSLHLGFMELLAVYLSTLLSVDKSYFNLLTEIQTSHSKSHFLSPLQSFMDRLRFIQASSGIKDPFTPQYIRHYR